VYVEKPMALSYEECQTIISASEKYKIPVFVAYYRRFFPYFLKIKEIIENKSLGEIINCQLTTVLPPRKADFDKKNLPWHLDPEISGGGYFFDLGCHQLDILDFLLGPIEEAIGIHTNRAKLYKVEDTLSASLKFESGVLAGCNWTYVGNENSQIDRIEIIGTKGMVRFGILGTEPILLNVQGKEQVFSFEKPKHVEQPMIEQVTKSLLGKIELKSNMYSAARTARVMDNIMGR
jgi:1,5-anhydro-D-fructose reductase (1,5-anhydro-D-mannitol-forming)